MIASVIAHKETGELLNDTIYDSKAQARRSISDKDYTVMTEDEANALNRKYLEHHISEYMDFEDAPVNPDNEDWAKDWWREVQEEGRKANEAADEGWYKR